VVQRKTTRVQLQFVTHNTVDRHASFAQQSRRSDKLAMTDCFLQAQYNLLCGATATGGTHYLPRRPRVPDNEFLMSCFRLFDSTACLDSSTACTFRFRCSSLFSQHTHTQAI